MYSTLINKNVVNYKNPKYASQNRIPKIPPNTALISTSYCFLGDNDVAKGRIIGVTCSLLDIVILSLINFGLPFY